MIFSQVFIGSDHAGFESKTELIQLLQKKFPNLNLIDCGTNSPESCNYPDIAKNVSDLVLANQASCGVLICGSGVGISIAANRIEGVRAVLCTSSKLSELSRRHNNANIICFGARLQTVRQMYKYFKLFTKTAFEGGRHDSRVQMLDKLK